MKYKNFSTGKFEDPKKKDFHNFVAPDQTLQDSADQVYKWEIDAGYDPEKAARSVIAILGIGEE